MRLSFKISLILIISIVKISITSAAVAALKNSGCAPADPRAWYQILSMQEGTPVTGVEKINRGPTSAKLAKLNDFSRESEEVTLVESGAKYFLYDDHYQPQRDKKLVLLDTGICVYLTVSDVKYSYDSERLAELFHTSEAAFFSLPHGPVDCGGTPITFTPGEVYAFTRKSDDTIEIHVDPRTKNNISACNPIISTDLVKIVDISKSAAWDEIGAFRAAAFSNFQGLSKECNEKYVSVDKMKLKVDENINLGFKWPVAQIQAGEEGEFAKSYETDFTIEDGVDFKEFPFKNASGDTFYFTTIVQCRPDHQQGETTYQFNRPPNGTLFWRGVTIISTLKSITDNSIKDFVSNNSNTGRPYVTCIQQYWANLKLLELLRWHEQDAAFVLAQIGVWPSYYHPNNGLKCLNTHL